MSEQGALAGTALGDPAAPCVHFGGPDLPPRLLRDMLCAHVEAVPPGGEISWSTYYFRDRALAMALMAASDRGVRVRLHVEACPRRKTVNRAVIALLREHGLHGGLHLHAPPIKALAPLHPHLHSKIYCFSHPVPHVLVGSFNPSGDQPEDADIIREIGDQDRGHNMLVEFSDPGIVAALRAHVLGLSRFALRFRADQNKMVDAGENLAWFYPRLRPAVIEPRLDALQGGDRIKGAISHLKQGFLTDSLIRAAKRGVAVTLLVHDTERRVPGSIVMAMIAAGADIARYVHPERLPLHAKFLLVTSRHERAAYFGSFNYNPRSRYMNREILMASTNEALFASMNDRFDQIAAEAQTHRQMG